MSKPDESAPSPLAATSSAVEIIDILCYIAAAGIWIAFVVFFLGMAFSRGVLATDDSCHGLIAKSLVHGFGYSTTMRDVEGLPSIPLRFNPGIGTGPSVLLPCAAVIFAAGNNDAFPGVSAILTWSIIISVVWFLLARQVSGFSILLSVGLFSLAVLLLFGKSHLFQWFVLLGEIPALAYLLMAHWLAAQERSSQRMALLAGSFVGLAFQAKFLALLLCSGAIFIYVMRLFADGYGRKESGVRLAIYTAGCVAPTMLFETYKFCCLGFARYYSNWQQFLAATHNLTVDRAEHFSSAVILRRLAVLNHDFFIDIFAWTIFIIFCFCLLGIRLTKKWTCLLAGLWISVVCSLSYWLCFSIGWPRYVVMAVGMACFALIVPICALPQVRFKIAYSLVALILLSPAFSVIPNVWRSARNELFRPTGDRVARQEIVAAIQERRQRGPINLVSRYWTEYVDIEFCLPGCMNFNDKPTEPKSPAVQASPCKTIVLLDRSRGASQRAGALVDEHVDVERVFGRAIESTVASAGNYELLQLKDAPTENVMPITKRPGAFIAASPNPVPFGLGAGITTIAWDTGNGDAGEVVLAVRGKPEQLMTRGVHGHVDATWIDSHTVNEFRLYSGPDRKTLLGSVRVTRDN